MSSPLDRDPLLRLELEELETRRQRRRDRRQLLAKHGIKVGRTRVVPDDSQDGAQQGARHAEAER